MAEWYNNIMCVTVAELTESNPSVISATACKRYLDKYPTVRVRRACRNTPALLAYEQLRSDIKERYENLKGNPYQMVERNLLEENVLHDLNTEDFFKDYRYSDGKRNCPLPPEKQTEYYFNAIVLQAILTMESQKRTTNKGKGTLKSANMWSYFLDKIEALDKNRFAHGLKYTNPDSLRRAVRQFRNEGLQCLIHGNFGNKVAAKIDDEVKQSVMQELLADPRNLDNVQIANLYNEMAGVLNWKTISEGAVALWRDKLRRDTEAGRRGLRHFKDTLAMQSKRVAPSYPLYFWSIDGWDVELYYQKTHLDKKGNNVTTYHHRLTMVVILDACVKYPIGYAIGSHETPELIKEALRNAANHTAELFGWRHRTQQIQSDRYSIKKLGPSYTVSAVKHTPAEAKNAKAKPIEPYFKYLNKTYCQLLRNWSGFGVTARKESQPNVDFLNKICHQFPDEAGCREQIELMIRMERSKKVKRYVELFQSMPEEHKVLMTKDEYLIQFGETTGFTNRITGEGVMATIHGNSYTFDCFDPEFREYISSDWLLKYDPQDLNQVLAVNAKGRNGRLIEEIGTLQFMLEQKYVQPMALIERGDNDAVELQRIREFNKTQESIITQRRADSRQMVEDLLHQHPGLNNSLAKHVLLDSQGQHKDQRNAERAAVAEKAKNLLQRQAQKADKSKYQNEREEIAAYHAEKVNINEYL